MPFVATLTPAANNQENAANWDINGAGDAWEAIAAEDAATYGRNNPADPDGGHASATFYLTGLPPEAARITADAAAPPVRVRSWCFELEPSGGFTISHGIGYGASTAGSGTFSVSGGTSHEVGAYDSAQNPDGPRAWVITDFPGDGSGAYVVIGANRPTVLGEGAYFDRVRCDVRFERNPQAGIYDVVGPWLPLAGILGGVAHARVDMRGLAREVYQASRRRLWWTADEDRVLGAELRALRWPTVVDLAAR
jgi:hypothetical protein